MNSPNVRRAPATFEADGVGTPFDRPVILVFCPFYLPGYRGGGPIQSIANLVRHLGNDFDFRIVTFDRDLGDNEPYPHITQNAWNSTPDGAIFYVDQTKWSLGALHRMIQDVAYDLIYLNSCFDRHLTLPVLLLGRLGRLRATVLLAPRGELSAGALGLKRLKKALFLRISSALGLHRNVIWHASTSHEAEDIRRELFKYKQKATPRVLVARNLLAPITRAFVDPAIDSENSEVFKICFLSRLTPKKNLDFALAVLADVSKNTRIRFTVYGPVEDRNYWTKCQDLWNRMPGHVEVVYGGSIPNEFVGKALSAHDLFFLPTLGENFGHVFVDAWAAGLPVLVSDQTPWRDLESQGIGWDVPLSDKKNFVAVIERTAALDREMRTTTRRRCIEFAIRLRKDADGVRMSRDLLMSALSP